MKKPLLVLTLLFSLFVNAQDFWTEVSLFPEQAFAPKQISIVDANVVWVYGYNGSSPGTTAQQWLRTTDGGATWTQGNFNLGNVDLQVSALHALSETVAYVSANATVPSPSGGIWMTSDAGATWTRQPYSFNRGESFANFVHLWNATEGIAVGDPNNGYFEIYKLENTGQNWVRVPAANIATPLEGETGYTSLYEIRNNSIWFGTNKGRIFKSNDFGQTWPVVQSPLADFDSSTSKGRFAFKNQNEGLLIDGNWNQHKSTDAGNTWEIENPATSAARNGNIAFIPETANAYFSWGEERTHGMRGASYTTDGGLSWIDLNETDQQPLYVMNAKFKDSEVGFCFGYYINDSNPVGLFFYKLGEDTFRRFLSTNNQALTSNLSVVPNPATNLVEISGKNIQSVVISDISGKKVLTESYTVSDAVVLNLSQLQKGIYLAKVSDNSHTSKTIKIIKN